MEIMNIKFENNSLKEEAEEHEFKLKSIKKQHLEEMNGHNIQITKLNEQITSQEEQLDILNGNPKMSHEDV